MTPPKQPKHPVRLVWERIPGDHKILYGPHGEPLYRPRKVLGFDPDRLEQRR